LVGEAVIVGLGDFVGASDSEGRRETDGEIVGATGADVSNVEGIGEFDGELVGAVGAEVGIITKEGGQKKSLGSFGLLG
jgi:hypothetical protein